MTYCPKCGKEVVWGESEVGHEKIAMNPWSEGRYIFVYGPTMPIVRWMATWVAHQCVLPEEAA